MPDLTTLAVIVLDVAVIVQGLAVIYLSRRVGKLERGVIDDG